MKVKSITMSYKECATAFDKIFWGISTIPGESTSAKIETTIKSTKGETIMESYGERIFTTEGAGFSSVPVELNHPVPIDWETLDLQTRFVRIFDPNHVAEIEAIEFEPLSEPDTDPDNEQPPT